MKLILVTGASTGIGRATAIALAKQNYKVILTARRENRLNKTRALIKEEGGEAMVLPADLSSPEAVLQLTDTIKDHVRNSDDTLHAIINIAGVWHGETAVYAGRDFNRLSTQVMLDTYQVGLIAPSLIVHQLLEVMGEGAKVVNLSGTFENGAKGWLPYYASKRALEDFTVGLAEELEDKNIQVNCVSPSDTATEEYKRFFPEYIDEAVEPEEVAEVIAGLVEPKDERTGQVLVVRKGEEVREGFHR